MWYVISPTDGGIVSICTSHAEAIRQAHHLASLRRMLIAGHTARYTVRKA